MQQRPPGWTAQDAERALRLAHEAWPELVPPDDAFLGHLASRTPALASDIDPERVAELYLAFCCARGDAKALAELDASYRVAVSTAVARVASQRHGPDDLAQIIRQHLFVGDDPAIGQYSGRGSLGAWLGVVALRTALNATRRKEGTPHLPELDAIEDPELDFLRDKYKADFRRAFDGAVTELSPRERLLLRQHLVEHLTVRELGRIHGVNSGTVSRWIVRARDALAERTIATLRAELDVTPDELESIMGMIRSQVELSLTRALT